VIGKTETASELPKGWVWTVLDDIALTINPGFPSGKWQRDSEQGVPHLRPMNINENGAINLLEIKYVQPQKNEPLSKGDILFNNTNSPKWVGKTAYIKEDTNWAFSNHMTRIKVYPSINAGFVSYYLYHLFLKGFFLSNCLHHVNQASVNTTFLKSKVPIPLAPTNEQFRIVGKVEELFSFLDAGIESLRKVQAQLKRYRQAVLKYAFEGKLTEQWRETHKDQIEPAGTILKELCKPPLNQPNLPDVPEFWSWTNLETITSNLDGKRVPVSSEKRESVKGIFPYYGASGIIDHVNDYLFDGNYLLVGEDGANLLARSTPIAFQAAGKFWVNNHAHILSLLGGIPIGYLEHYLNEIDLAKYVTGTAQPKLTQRNMNKIPVPLAPLKEQIEIVTTISRQFSIIDEMKKECLSMLKYSNQLRHSILKTAFEGALVPQDPADEPAEKLLERIKAEWLINKSKNSNQVELSEYVK
jgi:type I restriction enzyme, S subunit